jgi:hypothetical protein
MAPQTIAPPQPSAAVSQSWAPHAAAADFGVQPQTFAVAPPPQVCGAAQLSPQ